jgi:hypothetical protein
VTSPVDAVAVTFNAASTRGSRLSESIFASMTTDTPMVVRHIHLRRSITFFAYLRDRVA